MAHSITLPSERVELHGCSAAEQLTFSLTTTLGEVFVPTNEAREDLPLRVTIRPETNDHRKRDWYVPFPGGIRLQPAKLKAHRRHLKAPTLSKLVLEHGQVRASIERFMLDWVGSEIRIHVYHFPKDYMGGKEPHWRIEATLCGEVIAQWNGSHEIVERLRFFCDFKNPVL